MRRFPDGFSWGCATASYQIEGSPLADGAGPSIWHRFSHTPGTIQDGDTGDVACDHYRRWADDVALMRDLGLTAYRFSIAWPRVVPGGRGPVNEAGLDFYDRLVDALVEAGIEPVPTLYHWDLPAALQDEGGWANRATAEAFGGYAAAVFDRLGDRVRTWITLNEPFVSAWAGHVLGVHAPGIRDLWAGTRAAHHLLLAHARAVEAYRAGHGGRIGITVNMNVVHPETDGDEDRAAALRTDALNNRLFSDAIYLGSYPEELEPALRDAWFPVADGDLEAISAPIDFIGLNSYFRTVVVHEPGAGLLDAKTVRRDGPHTQMGWEIHPEGLGELLDMIHERYGEPDVYITENGAAFADVPDADGYVDDPEREDYLRRHFEVAHDAIARGVKLRGYFVWTLYDNFEWAFGSSKRFGIVRVDHDTQRRTIKRSGHWYRTVIEANGLET